jgi:octanoyl-[GcvH]:protein N-octanoyltransferase
MAPPPQVELLRESLEGEPALDVALAQALLDEVARRVQRPVLRIYHPARTVAFSRRDALLPGFAAAARAARRRGFAPVLRAPGGRAAAYADGCLVTDEIWPEPDSLAGIQERFAVGAERMAAALRGLGVDARVGEVPGEYCAGAFTVNARGRRKLIGSAQRLIRGAWLLSTVVVVDGADELRGVLEDVYGELAVEWDPATVGSIAGERPGSTVDLVEKTLLAAYAERCTLVPGDVSDQRRAVALELVVRHRVSE